MTNSEAEKAVPNFPGILIQQHQMLFGFWRLNQWAVGHINNTLRRMVAEFDKFRKEVNQGQEEVAVKALKRAWCERPYAFMKTCNEVQATFNAKVNEALVQAGKDLTFVMTTYSSTPAVCWVRETIEKERRLLEEGQKLILSANRFEHGWCIGYEYTANDLAEQQIQERGGWHKEKQGCNTESMDASQGTAWLGSCPQIFLRAHCNSWLLLMQQQTKRYDMHHFPWSSQNKRRLYLRHPGLSEQAFFGQMGHLHLYICIYTSIYS